ncbi:hypothetical protein, partial [Salmonella sp. SAL4443]|uniref:hypothetical protein n=1 Tax=Salmonella sp. SAL4443 TaxID=3159898 RepID=UPI00397AA63E
FLLARERTEIINQSLEDAASEAQSLHPEFSIFFDHTFYNTHIDGNWLAVDCFHPGRSGQTQLAEVLWQGMPWFH